MLIAMYWLDVSPDDILAAEVRRLEWEDAEDAGELEVVASCTGCGNPCYDDFDMRVRRWHGDAQILCPACDRRMWAEDDIEQMPTVPNANGVAYGLDWDLIIKRVTPDR
jgi:hypothetical protein